MSGLTKNRSFIGKGSIYAAEIGGTGGLITLGNCSELNVAVNEDKKEQQDYQNAGGGVTNTVSRISSVTASVTALSLSPKNVALALRGLVNAHTGATQTDEQHVGYAGAFIALDHILDPSETVTVTSDDAGTTYVEGTDYAIGTGGLKLLDTATFTDGDTLKVTYTSVDSYDIEGLTAAGKEYQIVFDGLNEADSGKSVLVTMHRVKFNPTQALSLISDDFGTLPMTFDIIKDESVTGTGESQFFKMQIAD